MSYNLAQRKMMGWKGVQYPVYSEDVVFRIYDGPPVCPLCLHEGGINVHVRVMQDGFWDVVWVTCCQCSHCNKYWAVRIIEEKPNDQVYPDPLFYPAGNNDELGEHTPTYRRDE